MNYRVFLSTVSLLALSACGDADTPPITPPAADVPPAGNDAPPPAAVSSSVSSTGVITGFSSVVVNGVAHETDSETVVAVEDETETVGDDSGLLLGMIVTIQATEVDGVRTSSRIDVDEQIFGPVDTVSPDAANPGLGTFVAVGQTVIVDDNTVFDDDIGDNDGVPGIDIRDLDTANQASGEPLVVEVSGFPNETGVLATRIERESVSVSEIGRVGVSGDELEVQGFVDSVAADGGSFAINDAVFLTSGTVFDDNLAANQDLVGVFVEVRADIDAAGDLIAVSVEREDDVDGSDDDEFEIEGLLQSVDTVADPDVIVVNGVTIPVSDASMLTAQVGNRIEIDGNFDANGILTITELSVEVENSVRTEDRIVAVDAAQGVFTTRLGLDILPTNTSRIEDDVQDGGDRLTPDEFLARLGNDDFIEARGIPTAEGVTWTRIEREEEEDLECSLRGPVDAGSISDPTFSILGVAVNTTGLDDSEFEDANGVSIGRAAFFSQLVEGSVVEAESDETGNGCRTGELATGIDGEVSFEPDDGVQGNDNDDDDDDDDNDDGPDGNDNETIGIARNINAAANTFDLAGRTVTVTADTLIDASLVERARGVELGDDDLRFGDLPETLDQLVLDGDRIEAVIDAEGNAILIEDD